MTKREFDIFKEKFLTDGKVTDGFVSVADAYLSDGLKSFSVTRDEIANDERVKTIIDKFCKENNFTLDADIYKGVSVACAECILNLIKQMQAREMKRVFGI